MDEKIKNDEEKTKKEKNTKKEIVPEVLVFAKPLDPNERKHFEIILKANRESIASLRKQLQDSLAENERLSSLIPVSETKE